MTSETDLEYLSKVSGVDFHALRDKYSGNKYKTERATASSADDNGKAKYSEEKAKEINEKLSQYHICKSCNGMGIVKTFYNHMMLEKTCEECDGDSLILQSNMEKAVSSIHPIDDR